MKIPNEYVSEGKIEADHMGSELQLFLENIVKSNDVDYCWVFEEGETDLTKALGFIRLTMPPTIPELPLL